MGLLSPTDESLLGSVAVPTQGSLTLPGPSYSSALAAQEVLQVCRGVFGVVSVVLTDSAG